MNNNTILDDKLHWYKDAVIYELHIKAFFDSNGDGIGDFGGLLQKLDYLQDLGVTAIWVLPFYPSPLRDDGYDIADYYAINPRYGTIEQFQQFLQEAHKRNLKVITELVVNHTSDQHPWFQRARRAPKGSPERDFYVWTDDPTQYKDVRIIFQDYETSNWTWDAVAQQYYWHRFFHHQPDLNYDNPQVQEEIIKVMDYWCSMGVDGFRLDAVPYLFEREGTNGENLPETHVFLKKLRARIDELYPGICFLAEANMWPEDSASYFGDGDECHMNYHFPVMPRMFMALQREDRYPITDIFDQTPPIPETCQWAIFLRNHDELTLEMVTDEERDYMYSVYAKDPKAKINLGIRHRLAPLMDNDRRRIELMNSLLFSLPGTPVIYYGDEIGMGDNFYLGDRDGVRTPMQWSPDRNAGFSATNPQRLYLPVILDPQYHYESVNVETQRSNTSSLFWFMKRIINMRKQFKAFSRGDMKFIHVDNPKVLAFTRTYEDETLLIISNLSKYAQPAEIDLKEFRGYVPMETFSKNNFPPIRESAPYFFTLAPHSFQWFVLQKPKTEVATEVTYELLQTDHWEALFSRETLAALQTRILPQYFQRVPWFPGRNRSIFNISVVAHTSIPLGEKDAGLLLVEVTTPSGLPEYYQLPVVFCNLEEGREVSDSHPGAVVARLKAGQEEGFLCDATYTTGFQQLLLASLADNKRYMASGEVVFSAQPEVKQLLPEDAAITTRVHATNEQYSTIVYNNRYFLKLYRRVDRGLHPDVEITRFLTEQAPGTSTHYLGTIDWHLGTTSYSLGLLEKLEENHLDGQRYMQDRVANFIERILARDRSQLATYPKAGTLTHPVVFESLPDDLKEFIGTNGALLAKSAGISLARLHKAVAGTTAASMVPEAFSLHYQRSLFSVMSSLVREMRQLVELRGATLPAPLAAEVSELSEQRDRLLDQLRKVYLKKFDVLKIRTHGNLSLAHVLQTGRDTIIHDFGGNASQPFSQRRLRRSPLRDVASMVCSFYYVAYEGFLTSAQIPKEEQSSLLPFADFWAHYMSGFFMSAYLGETRDSGFIPAEQADFEILLQSLLLETAISMFNDELANRPERVIVPLRIIQHLIGTDQPVVG